MHAIQALIVNRAVWKGTSCKHVEFIVFQRVAKEHYVNSTHKDQRRLDKRHDYVMHTGLKLA